MTNMQMRIPLLMLVAFHALTACTGMTGRTANETPSGAARSAVPAAAADLAIARVAVELTPAARQQAEADERFNPDALRDAILAELRSRQLLDLAHSDTGRALVIRLEEFEVRAASNVVMFGRLASTGVLDGVARIRRGSSEASEFRVRAEVSMQIARKSDDKNPLKTLYRGFAKQFVDALVGVAPRQPQRQ
jgi:hypothetical protein